MRRMIKLAPGHLRTLAAIDDWKAPFEVAEMTERPVKAVESYLRFLVEFGFAKYGQPNNTYRITSAGRAALANSEHKGTGDA